MYSIIFDAHRVPLRDSSREGPWPIVCKFTRRLARNELMDLQQGGQQGQRVCYRFRRGSCEHVKRQGCGAYKSQVAKTLRGHKCFQESISIRILLGEEWIYTSPQVG